jgi:alpha-glucosidase
MTGGRPDMESRTYLGPFTSLEGCDDGVWIRCDGGSIRVSVLGEGTVKVQLSPEGGVTEEHSHAVVHEGRASFSIVEKENEVELRTQEIILNIKKDPLLLSFSDKDGHLLCRDCEPMRWKRAEEGYSVVCTKEMPLEEHYYGLGEKSGFLDKRRSSLVMWNTDAYEYDRGSDPLYVSIPFFTGLRNGIAYGIFFDNTYRAFLDFGRAREDSYMFGSAGGEFRYYFFYGPDIKKVIERYTEITGKPFMPPEWALGHQMSRYSYYPQDRVVEIAKKIREERIPCDAMYLDIDHSEGYLPFVWSRDFPEPERMMEELRKLGMDIVPIVDPAMKVSDCYPPYAEALERGYLLKRRGYIYMDRMWPGLCAWPDFTREDVREWWGEKYGVYTGLGIRGIWNDMNEPSVFNDRKTMKDDVMFGDGFSHAKHHNDYALFETKATYEGLKNLGVEQPFVLSRAGFAGVQRYAALWTGDNTASWEHLALQIPMLLNMSLSGLSLVGSDIGGFIGSSTPELLVRWYEANALIPFFRNHTGKGTYDQEPWVFGRYYEDIIRRQIEMRYELLPYLYSLAYESHTRGYPIMRPLFFEFQSDEGTYTIEDEFMIGPYLLAAPVIREGARARSVYLPEGDWYDYNSRELYRGSRRMLYDAPLDRLPLFVRSGAIIPKQQAVQSTKEESEWWIEVYGKEPSAFTLYREGRATDVRWNGEALDGSDGFEIIRHS